MSTVKSRNACHQFFADLWDPVDLCGALRPLLVLSFLCGMMPFKPVGSPGNRRLKMTFIGFANTVIHFALFITSYVLRLTRQRSLSAHFFHSEVSRFGEDLQIFVSFTALAFTLILCFVKRNKLRTFFEVIGKVDKKLAHLGAVFNYKWFSRIILLSLTVTGILYSIFIFGLIFITRSLEDKPKLVDWIFFFVPIGVVTVLKLQFYCMMQLIKYRLRFINLLLNNLQGEQINQTVLENMDKNKVYTCKGMRCDVMKLHGGMGIKREKYDVIADLCRVHDDICDACYVAEDYFSHQMLTAVSIEFVSTLFNLYFMFEVVYTNTMIAAINKIEFISFFAVYTTISMGSLYALLRSSVLVTTEVSFCKN